MYEGKQKIIFQIQSFANELIAALKTTAKDNWVDYL